MKNFRKGLPTKTFLIHLMEDFFNDRMGINTYFPNYILLNWQSNKFESRIEEFVKILKNNGIVIENFRKYKSPTTGQIKIIKKII